MRKLVGMLLLITLLTQVYPVYANGSIQTSYFTIEDSLLEYFKVDIRESKEILTSLLGEEGSWYMIDVNGQTGFVHKNHATLQ